MYGWRQEQWQLRRLVPAFKLHTQLSFLNRNQVNLPVSALICWESIQFILCCGANRSIKSSESESRSPLPRNWTISFYQEFTLLSNQSSKPFSTIVNGDNRWRIWHEATDLPMLSGVCPGSVMGCDLKRTEPSSGNTREVQVTSLCHVIIINMHTVTGQSH